MATDGGAGAAELAPGSRDGASFKADAPTAQVLHSCSWDSWRLEPCCPVFEGANEEAEGCADEKRVYLIVLFPLFSH